MNQFEPNNLDVQASTPTKKTFVQTVIEIFSTALKRTFVKVGIAVVLALIVILIYTATQDSVQDDLLDYLNNDLPSIVELESEAIDLYNAAREDTANDYEMYVMLRDTVLPVAREWSEAAEDIEIETEEVREVHELYIKMVNENYSAMTLMLSALETQDYTIIAQANEKLGSARKMGRDYQAAVERLAEEHEVELTGK